MHLPEKPHGDLQGAGLDRRNQGEVRLRDRGLRVAGVIVRQVREAPGAEDHHVPQALPVAGGEKVISGSLAVRDSAQQQLQQAGIGRPLVAHLRTLIVHHHGGASAVDGDQFRVRRHLVGMVKKQLPLHTALAVQLAVGVVRDPILPWGGQDPLLGGFFQPPVHRCRVGAVVHHRHGARLKPAAVEGSRQTQGADIVQIPRPIVVIAQQLVPLVRGVSQVQPGIALQGALLPRQPGILRDVLEGEKVPALVEHLSPAVHKGHRHRAVRRPAVVDAPAVPLSCPQGGTPCVYVGLLHRPQHLMVQKPRDGFDSWQIFLEFIIVIVQLAHFARLIRQLHPLFLYVLKHVQGSAQGQQNHTQKPNPQHQGGKPQGDGRQGAHPLLFHLHPSHRYPALITVLMQPA